MVQRYQPSISSEATLGKAVEEVSFLFDLTLSACCMSFAPSCVRYTPWFLRYHLKNKSEPRIIMKAKSMSKATITGFQD